MIEYVGAKSIDRSRLELLLPVNDRAMCHDLLWNLIRISVPIFAIMLLTGCAIFEKPKPLAEIGITAYEGNAVIVKQNVLMPDLSGGRSKPS